MTNQNDYITVGDGSAGCVLAGPLSADPGKQVLLLERGGEIVLLAGLLASPRLLERSCIGSAEVL